MFMLTIRKLEKLKDFIKAVNLENPHVSPGKV